VFFTSGSVLVLEILAGRLMAPYVGVSIETFTGIIGTILAGIAAGSALGGRLADRHSPSHLLPLALIGGGALSWLSLPLVSWVGPTATPGTAAIVLISVVAFLLPAATLSSVTPIVAKMLLTDVSQTGRVVGTLSAAGTAGALAGTFLTGFVLVAWFGTRSVVITIGALLVAVGLALAVRLGSWRRGQPMLLVPGLVLVGLAVVSTDRCEFETAYACGAIEADPDGSTGRLLVLNQASHAYLDDDPLHLEFRYIRLLAAVADALPPGPLDTVHVGGGGLTLPRYLAEARPGSTSEVLEIDPDLVDVVAEALGDDLDDGVRVTAGDARLTLEALPHDSADLVIGDAFTGMSVPWHLTTDEFVASIADLVRGDGVYSMNVIDAGSHDFARAMARTLLSHFDHLAVIAPPDEDGRARNWILVASNGPLEELAPDPADGLLLEDATGWVGDAQRLTDDFAPADQLARR